MPEQPIDPSDLIWINDASREYDRSRTWLEQQGLTVVTIPGDKKFYLLRSELARLLAPRAHGSLDAAREALRRETERETERDDKVS